MGLRSGESCGDPGAEEEARNVKISFALGTRAEGGRTLVGLVCALVLYGDHIDHISDPVPGGGDAGLFLVMEIGERVENRRRCRLNDMFRYKSATAVNMSAGRYIELKMRKVSGRRQSASANVGLSGDATESGGIRESIWKPGRRICLDGEKDFTVTSRTEVFSSILACDFESWWVMLQ
jgi:hypothetical protein